METTEITSAQIIFPDKLTLDEKMSAVLKEIATLKTKNTTLETKVAALEAAQAATTNE